MIHLSSNKANRLQEYSLSLGKIYRSYYNLQREREMFLTRGRTKVTTQPSLHEEQYETILKVKKEKKSILSQERVHVRRKEGYSAAEKRMKSREVEVCWMEENEIIGDLEMLLNLETYATSILCKTDTVCYFLEKKNIERLIKKAGTTWFMFQKLALSKLDAWLPRNVPLFSKTKEIIAKELPNNENKQLDKKVEAMSELIKLFLNNKTPLIDPCVPGTIYYMTKNAEKARQHMETAKKGAKLHKLAPEIKLERARRQASGKRPRSRRELERLTNRIDTNWMKSQKRVRSNILRPKTAPPKIGDFQPSNDWFDEETSDKSLTNLEFRIANFLADNVKGKGRELVSQVAGLKRFNITGADNVPIAGGTVLIREKKCNYSTNLISDESHQHIRRFIIPREAYSIATRCLSSSSTGH